MIFTVQDCVSVSVDGAGILYKRLEEVRLMESRKSARLGEFSFAPAPAAGNHRYLMTRLNL
jgi:hypothetical protein